MLLVEVMLGSQFGMSELEAAERAGLGLLVAQIAPPRVLCANETALGLFGVSAEELLRRSPFDFVAPEQLPVVAARLRQRLSGAHLPPAELTLVRGDGTRVAVECRIADLTIQGVRAVAIFMTRNNAVTIVDVAADARYRDLVDAAPDGVTITRGTQFLYANRAALDLVGVTTFEELSRSSLADLLSPEDLLAMTERTTAMLRDGARFRPRDYVLQGLRRPVTVEVSSVIIEFEGAPAALAFVRDVSEARRARIELERAQRLTALGTLVAGVAHEVNNPLTFANLAAAQLGRFLASGCVNPAEASIALSNLNGGLERIGSLVHELRGFVRVEGQALASIDLQAVLASALRMSELLIRHRARLEVEIGELGELLGSPRRLEQVFVNLLLNAAQSFEADDVASNVVRVCAVRRGDETTVSIEDNGRGIAAEDRAHVFDPFFTTKPLGEGMGLGLSICHAIVTQHGGRIELSSGSSGGTRATVVLPARSPASERSQPASVPEPASSALPRRRVLIVDDEPALGRALREVLAPRHDVVVANGGLEAIEHLERLEAAFDVVLCDLTMPDLPGLTLFRQACARRPELRQRFVFMTGGLFDPDAFEQAGAAAAPRLEKPFDARELETLIAEVAGVAEQI